VRQLGLQSTTENGASIKIADGILGIAGILELDVTKSWRSTSDPDGYELAVVAHLFLDFGRAWGV